MGLPEKIRILIVDDHVLFRRGLRELLSDNPDFEIVGELDDGVDVLGFRLINSIDVILMDIQMPYLDGIKTVNKLRMKKFNTSIIMLTVSGSERDIIESIKAGADGYILKSAEYNELEHAIYAVHRGERTISISLVSKLFNLIKSKNDFPFQKLLSKRELDVLRQLSENKTYEEIANAMYISENTVKTHIKHLYEKMSAANRGEAVEKGILWGIIEN